MTSALTTTSGGQVAPPDWLNQYQNPYLTKPLMQSAGEAPPRISLKGNRFHKIVDGNTETLAVNELDLVIVSYIPEVSRVYFSKAYNPSDEAVMPDCWATDGRVPDAAVPDATAQGGQNGTCQGCPMDVKGSGQGTSKACGYRKRLMVIPLDEYEYGDDALTYVLDAPGMSIFGEDAPQIPAYSLQTLATSMARAGFDPSFMHAIAIRVMFDARHSVPKLLFQPLEYVQREELDWIMRVIDKDRDVIDAQTAAIITGAIPAAKTAAPAPVQQAAPTPQATAPAPVQQAAPTPQATAGAPARRRAAAPVQQQTAPTSQAIEPEIIASTPAPAPTQAAPQAAPARRRAPGATQPQPVQGAATGPQAQAGQPPAGGLPPTRRGAARAAQAQGIGAAPAVANVEGLQAVLNSL